MRPKNRPFIGVLREAIDLGQAPARGCRLALALPPDDSDRLAYAQSGLQARWEALDNFYKLNSSAADIWEQRAKALVERKFGVRSTGPQWWARLACSIAGANVPGFSFRRADTKRIGAPDKWTDERLAQLFADVEYLKRKSPMSVRQICQRLPQKKEYKARWSKFNAAALRKAYLEAKKRSRGLLFKITLCGVAATIPSNRVDPIEAAIELHALKP
jgi:hypothetical protein